MTFIFRHGDMFLFNLRIITKNKGVTRSCKSKADRQHNGQKKKDKGTNTDLQNITQKYKDRATQTTLKTRGEIRCSGRLSHFCYLSGTRRVYLSQKTLKPFRFQILWHWELLMKFIWLFSLGTCISIQWK
jgi:hypothetical protein